MLHPLRPFRRSRSLPALVLWLLSAASLGAGCTVTFDEASGTFTLGNGLVERRVRIEAGRHAFHTTVFKDLGNGLDYTRAGNREFAFRVNGRPAGGGVADGMVDYRGHEVRSGADGARTLLVSLSGTPGTALAGIDLAVAYEIYPELPLVRKWLTVVNRTAGDVTLTDPEWENTSLEIGSPGWEPRICTYADIYGQYGQSVFRPPYVGRAEDPAVMLYDYRNGHGAIVGNEAPAILKRTDIFPDRSRIAIGMGRRGDEFPFELTLAPGESFESPKGFILLHDGPKWQDAFEGPLAQFVRERLGVQLFRRKHMPLFLYNTWTPFNTNINEKLIREIADVTSRAGVEYLIIDDGWSTNYGDWVADPKKFPDGLKPVCDYIRAKGMKPGLWISLASADAASEVGRRHPEWFVRDQDGRPASLHGEYMAEKGIYTMNLTTPWCDFIKERISHLVETCGLGYVKLDLAAVYSAYKLNSHEVGDYATAGRAHRSKNESIYVLYRKVCQLLDELKARHPDLYVDFTYELYGRVFGVDYALLQHADGDWLSNIQEAPPLGPLYMRQLCFERARVLPPSTLLIGNLRMNDPRADLSFQSLLGATPLMLGDPRQLSAERITWFKEWSDWAREMERKYQFTRYYQTSDIFTRPEAAGWDGCARINPEKNGGLLCFYRNDSPEPRRTFRIVWVDENARYSLYSPAARRVIGTYTGRQLRTDGLTVEIPRENSAEILGIEKIE